jgi:hypothetical protein
MTLGGLSRIYGSVSQLTAATKVAPTFKCYCTTTGAQTLTLAALTVSSAVTVDWGDGSSNVYTGAGARTHAYAGAGTWTVQITPPTAITVITLSDNKVTLNSADIKTAINITTCAFSSLKAGTFNSSDVSAWRPEFFRLYSMPAGYAGTFNSSDVSAWRPEIFLLFSMPAGYTITITAAGFAGWITTTLFYMQGNSLLQAAVDQILADFWAGFPTRTATAGTILVTGNASPSGVYQAANPPTTGKEFAYELKNDSTNKNPTKKWTTITYT